MSFIELNQNDTTIEIVKKCNDNFRHFDTSDGRWIWAVSQRMDDLSYLDLNDKPSIENVELVGNKTFGALGLTPLSNSEIDNLTN